MHWEFATAGRILFGRGILAEVPKTAAAFGSRALLVHGRNPERALRLSDAFRQAGVESVRFSVPGEPTTETLTEGLQRCREKSCDLVIGLGGGSPMDSAKAIAALARTTGPVEEYLEVIGSGRTPEQPGLPCIAIPTTAGTGSEVTRNAVFRSVAYGVKVSLRGLNVLPRVAVVDSELTHSVPPEITAATGMDALTQLIEAFLSTAANPMTDAPCREGIARSARSLRVAFKNGDDADAREDLALASLLSGIALANARLGAVHALAGPLGGRFPVPHGAACARLLPEALAVNAHALRQRAPNSPVLHRLKELGRLLTASDKAGAEDVVDWVRTLVTDMQVQPLSAFGITADRFGDIVSAAMKSNAIKGNPVELTADELMTILNGAL